jgi:FKBP-type peptidyl-prolyl cis-trans isomerase 2
MQEGDFVYIDYTGKVKDTGKVFDSTKEEVAKKEDIFNSKVDYKPIPVVVGGGLVLKKIDETLKEMKINEKKTIEVSPEDGFGQRKLELIKLIPLSIFKERNIDVSPGRFVTIDRVAGKVVSVDGGRVKIDFNHPLAGKKLEYEIEIKEGVEGIGEKVKALVSHYSRTKKEDLDLKIKEKEVEITPKKKIDLPGPLKDQLSNILLKWLDLEKIKFVDVYTK